jgi:thiol-disulfide isomerase/thioredoxin
MSGYPRAPELPATFSWLNTDRPLSFARELKGRVVLLDFWTYCCINCMHVLPDLVHLEGMYRDEPFVVIGVHSAKFANEGTRQTVRAAVNRYEIAHPVVIDEDMRIWNEYAVRSWPTLVLVGADGRVVGTVAGEGNRDALDGAVARALAEGRQKGILATGPLRLAREQSVRAASGLAFPGKILADPAGGRLFISDSNHNRIVAATLPDASGRAWSEVRIEGLDPPRRAAVAGVGAAWPLAFTLPAQPEGAADLHVQVSFAYCHEGQGVCVPANPSWIVPVTFEPDGSASTQLTATVA